ncbi:MAG: DUF5666 domain-containing protein [Patescibacteria group bacterium]
MTTLIGSSAILFALLMALPAHAESVSTSAINVTGTLTAMSGTSVPATITLTAGATVYTVNVDSATVLVRKYNSLADLSEFLIGDILLIRGTLSKDAVNTITPKTIKDLSVQRAGGTFIGNIVTTNCAANSFTYKPKDREQQTVTITTNTKIIRGGEKITCTDLKNGELTRVIGLWRPATKQIEADRIIVYMKTLSGTISAIELTDGGLPATFTVDLANKQQWTVNITSTTKLFRKHMLAATIDEFSVGDKIEARGTLGTGKTLNAKIVRNNTVVAKYRDMKGTIKSIDAAARTFVLQMGNSKKMAEVTVTTSSSTKYLYLEKPVASTGFVKAACNTTVNKTFDDLTVGEKVKVVGDYASATRILAASRVIWDNK